MKFKRLISAALSAAMVFTAGAALAYTDVDEDHPQAEAIGILTKLGVMDGYSDGTFRPDATLTRAEAARYICLTLGLDGTAPTDTAFTDVPLEHWGSGYINQANIAGVVDGCGDGTYHPDDDLKYEQAVKMVVAALGYELVASGRGGYPVGYLAVAAENKVTTRVGGIIGQPATRAQLAQLIYNALEVGTMVQTDFGETVGYKVDEERTLRSMLETAE